MCLAPPSEQVASHWLFWGGAVSPDWVTSAFETKNKTIGQIHQSGSGRRYNALKTKKRSRSRTASDFPSVIVTSSRRNQIGNLAPSRNTKTSESYTSEKGRGLSEGNKPAFSNGSFTFWRPWSGIRDGGGDASGSVTRTTTIASIIHKISPEVQTGNDNYRISKYHYMHLFLLYIYIL